MREAETGDKARDLIRNPPTAFTLLITDIHMPGQLNGMQVARLMRAHHPQLPVIYTTGRPDVLAEIGHLGPKEALISKPFTPSIVLREVRRLLSRS